MARRVLVCLCVLLFLWGLVGCGGSRPRLAKPFRGDPVGYVQRGMASWYGPGFHGNLTANGEKYNMHAYTAAHRTLPMGSVVEVRSLTNHRRVTVRINDRGPFVKGRIIDLSRTAAKDLGMVVKGTDRVEIRVIGYRRHPGDIGFLRVQVGSFSDKRNALALKGELEKRYSNVRLSRVELYEGRHYRVLVGQFVSERKAGKLADELEARFSVDTLVVRDDS